MDCDIIMIMGSYVFALLFIFLFFVFMASAVSSFKKDKRYRHIEDVSIIIPCYNEEKNILKCLDSVYVSEYDGKMEVIAVDDGSDDNTLEVLKENKKKYPGLKIIAGEHEGKSESLNKGLKEASYGLVFTVDADTLLEKNTMKKIVQPFADRNVGATNGSCIARNKKSLLGMFQNIEYHYNNLIRKSFSSLFNTGIWFYGAFACYRKDVLERIGGFKKDSMTEDADIALEIYSEGYKTINVHDAFGHVHVPDTFSGLFRQRTRWWIGVLQALKKNKHLFSRKSSASILFLFMNQYWWSFYAFVSLPLFAFQYNYWLHYNLGSFYAWFIYTFRWFSLLGPVHVIYKIPEWGVSLYSIFGVMAGIITAVLIIDAIYLFKERLNLRNMLGIFFYFPYTIILNTIIITALFKAIFLKKSYFV